MKSNAIINDASGPGNHREPDAADPTVIPGSKTAVAATFRRALRVLPFAVSIGLLAAVIWWVSPQNLVAAASQLNWRLLLPATAIMVVALYLWDAACLPLVYGVEGRRVSYLQAVHLRGLAYLIGALNYELGQAALAWGMARLERVGVARMLARSVLLAYHDILVLLTTGLVGSLLTNDPRVERVRAFIAIGLLVALAVGVIFWALPEQVHRRFRTANTEPLLSGWTLRRSLKLLPMRLGYFGILIVYAAVALAICRVPVDHEVVLCTVPLVLLADGLPNFAGLGTREATLQLFLSPAEPNPVLLAMSLIWSTGMILVRFIIGLANLWLRQLAPVRDRGNDQPNP